jgi:hypothetical protein
MNAESGGPKGVPIGTPDPAPSPDSAKRPRRIWWLVRTLIYICLILAAVAAGWMLGSTYFDENYCTPESSDCEIGAIWAQQGAVVGALSAGIVIALVEVLLFRRRRRRIDY